MLKKSLLSLFMVLTLSVGAFQLFATANDMETCMDACGDEYSWCVTHDDDYVCAADYYSCYLDCQYDYGN